MGNQRSRAMTFFEVLVVIVCLLAAVAMLLPILAGAKRRTSRISCRSNLRQINLAFQIWAEDNKNQYPMSVSITNGGAMELIKTGNLAGCLQCTSNEMSTTKIFVCPDDPVRTFATNWNDLNSLHVSYFLSTEATNGDYQTVLDGDDNLRLNGSPVKSGLVDLSSNTSIEWVPGRHTEAYKAHIWSFPKRINWGNVGFADGHVDQFWPLQLEDMLQQMGSATNRIAIP